MEWLILLNIFCVCLSWYAASYYQSWSAGWWFNMTVSALNAVVALRFVL